MSLKEINFPVVLPKRVIKCILFSPLAPVEYFQTCTKNKT